MRIEDKKFFWWGLLGIGVAAFFYFLSRQNSQNQTSTAIQVPYLVPSTGASPSASQSLSDQQNIVGSSSNSQVPNFTNPYMVAANSSEAPGTWGFMPNLNVSQPSGPNNSVGLPFTSPNNQFLPNGISGVQSPVHL